MAYDPHHDSIIENLKEIFARCSELEDRLEFLENELEAFDDRNVVAKILESYHAEFDDVKHDRIHKDIGIGRAANVARVKDGKAVNSYKHLRQYCVAYQEGGIGCPDCYDFICDACGEHKEGKPSSINTETLCGVVMCESCSASGSCDSSCTDDACPVCGGNTPERIDEQIEWLEKKNLFLKKIAEQTIEEHKDTLQRLADNPVYDEDILDDEEEALLNRICDEIEAECFGEDFDYERERMKETLQRILDGERK